MQKNYLKVFSEISVVLLIVLLIRMLIFDFNLCNIIIAFFVLALYFICFITLHRSAKSLKNVCKQVSNIKGGDLTVAIESRSNDELGMIGDSINIMLENLRNLLSLINDEAEEMSKKSVEFASVSDETNRGIKVISATISEIAAGSQETGGMAVEAANKNSQVFELAENTAEESKKVLESTRNVLQSAKEGQMLIEKSVSVINDISNVTDNNTKLGNELKDKSTEVSGIVDLINSISDQTNLLALNAAIEAARAGEHGKGFAVVAEEVRQLSNQSQQAAKRISKIIEGMLLDTSQVVKAFGIMSKSTVSGVDTINKAKCNFESIINSIEKSREKLQQVVTHANNQSKATNDLMSTVHNVAAIAEESSASTQTVSENSEQISKSIASIAGNAKKLSNMAGNLEQALFKFKFSNVRTLRVGFEMTNNSICYAGMERFGQALEKRTDGRYKLKIYHSAQLGTGMDMIEMLGKGTLEMTYPSFSTLACFDKRFMIFDFPFIFKNEHIADKVLNGTFARKLLDMLEEYGFYGLAFAENGFRDTTNSVRPITKLEDIKGLRIRTMENDLHIDTWKYLGAEPVPLPYAKLYNAMRKKEIDGQENPVTAIYGDRFDEVQKYLTLTHHVYSPFVLMYSKKLWDTVPEDDKKIIIECAKEGALYTTEVNRKRVDRCLLELKSRGMKVDSISPNEMVKIKDAVKPVVDKYKNEIGKELVKELFDEIEKAEGI
ncbi:DctP family TRAP transporter solute-binding subunit [Clostridium ljungdahlii]|uniref:2,3-diketo-L-gulonate-binding periplasmic protein YiaO n=1 Tax=Clostridium ljungdahlii TaxID=1538 RepID=A0A162KJY4_9CLOT|nr:DctP family TRAP transporter solute-binding subunit [Clostridium ljungdahlii]OAA83362.1 2,3-diketo-L-gulonate-binding periplasmic protein YiaO precursor [Clostridium ljungdahlii]